MDNFYTIKEKFEINKFDYSYILRHKDTIVNSINRQSFFKIYLPVRGRPSFIEPCIRYIQNSIRVSGSDCIIALIESSGFPSYESISKKLGVEYVFIPSSLSKSGSQFNKSLCYNCGYLYLNKPKWCVFHDIDILVEGDFFLKINNYIKRKPIFIQPYTKRRVQLLGVTITKRIVENPNKILDLKSIKDKKSANPGSTGGSLVVRSDIFKKSEGYDPEIFYGYAPEDNFFWVKLESIVKEIGPLCIHTIGACHAGGAVYADNPPIEVYHMNHFSSYFVGNPKSNKMMNIYRLFLASSYDQKIKIMGLKKGYLSL